MKDIIYLDGLWGFRPDTAKEGIDKQFYNDDFADGIMLPDELSGAEMGEREYGFPAYDYKFEGFAWFQRKVILNDIRNKNVRLFLERTVKTMLWVNGRQVGGLIESTNTPHIYDVSGFLVNGENTITVLSDNTGSACLNGITGEISLRAFGNLYIENVQAFPDINKKSVKVRFRLSGCKKTEINVFLSLNEKYCSTRQLEVTADENGYAEFTYYTGDTLCLWSEYSPDVYTMTIELPDGTTEKISFGMREFTVSENIFSLNGRPIFLRGKQEFLLSNNAQDDFSKWQKKFADSKNYGINYYRFYGCPPETVFSAADAAGIYIETVLTKNIPADEALDIVRFFGNHPSFFLLSLNNSDETVAHLKNHDNRRIYMSGLLPEIVQIENYISHSDTDISHFLCMKNEIETVMFSEKRCGFCFSKHQHLSTLKSKKISSEIWRGCCSDKVLFAKCLDYNEEENVFTADIYTRCCNPSGFPDDYIYWEISADGHILYGEDITVTQKKPGLSKLGTVRWNVPDTFSEKQITLTITAKNTENIYSFFIDRK